MNIITLQHILNDDYLDELERAVKDGTSIALYREGNLNIDPDRTRRLAGIATPQGLAERMEEVSDTKHDFEAAVMLYEAYADLTPLVASMGTFWVYLTHAELSGYVSKRWSKLDSAAHPKEYVLDHWFMGRQGIMRNALASLWWGVHLTRDPDVYDPYRYTRVLFCNYTFREIVFGSSLLVRHRPAMQGILGFMHDFPEVYNESIENRGRFIAKFFNQLGGVKLLASLDREFFYNACVSIKEQILSVKTRGDLEDPDIWAAALLN